LNSLAQEINNNYVSEIRKNIRNNDHVDIAQWHEAILSSFSNAANHNIGLLGTRGESQSRTRVSQDDQDI